MREALAIVAEEGLEAMWARHEAAHKQLWAGLGELGLKPFVAAPEDRLVTVNTIAVPEGVDWAALCKLAMDKYSVEIAGGLGPTAGKIWCAGGTGAGAGVQGCAGTPLLDSGSAPRPHPPHRTPLPSTRRRVGLMGYNAKPANVELVLAAFRDGLKQQGWPLAQ